MRQLLSAFTLLSLNELLVLFNISYSHYTSLPVKGFSQEQFLISKVINITGFNTY